MGAGSAGSKARSFDAPLRAYEFKTWPDGLTGLGVGHGLHHCRRQHPQVIHHADCRIQALGLAIKSPMQSVKQGRIIKRELFNACARLSARFEVSNLAVRPQRPNTIRIKEDGFTAIGLAGGRGNQFASGEDRTKLVKVCGLARRLEG